MGSQDNFGPQKTIFLKIPQKWYHIVGKTCTKREWGLIFPELDPLGLNESSRSEVNGKMVPKIVKFCQRL